VIIVLAASESPRLADNLDSLKALLAASEVRLFAVVITRVSGRTYLSHLATMNTGFRALAGVLYCESMDKRLDKRHKRQVARAKLHSKTSKPDVRTHEQIEAARDASRPDTGRNPLAKFARAVRSKFAGSKESADKAEN
jgi:hypothetical protein